jgi:hypothetical protein
MTTPAPAPLSAKQLDDLAAACADAREDRKEEIAQHVNDETGERPWDWSLEIEVAVYQVEALIAAARAQQSAPPQAQAGERELLRRLHNWFEESAPEHYKGCGLWMDVSAALNRTPPPQGQGVEVDQGCVCLGREGPDPDCGRCGGDGVVPRTSPPQGPCGQRWCQPGDRPNRAFILRFDDPDRRDMVWTDEDAQARAVEAWRRFYPSWNCYLFSAHPWASPFASVALTVPVEIVPQEQAQEGERTAGQLCFEAFVGDWIGYTWDAVNPERKGRWERAGEAANTKKVAQLRADRDGFEATADRLNGMCDEAEERATKAEAELERVTRERDGWLNASIRQQNRADAAESKLSAGQATAEALSALVKMRKAIEADVRSAHHGRGNGTTQWMTEEDREFRGDLYKAFDNAVTALALSHPPAEAQPDATGGEE